MGGGGRRGASAGPRRDEDRSDSQRPARPVTLVAGLVVVQVRLRWKPIYDQPMPWIGEQGFLAEGAIGPAADALQQLVADSLPQTSYITDRTQWWSVAGPALVARAAQTLRSMMLLYEARFDLDGATLTRTLFEQLLTFAYLAHAPEDRLLPYESADLDQSERIVAGVRAIGYEMNEPEPWDREFLAPRPAPLKLGLPKLADHADQEWADVPRLFFRGEQPFRLMYELVYRPACRVVHGKSYATGAFIDADSAPTVVVRATERPSGVIGYEWGVWCFAMMLVISSRAQGWPPEGAVETAMRSHLPANAA